MQNESGRNYNNSKNNNNNFFINLPLDPHWHIKTYIVKYSLYKSYTQEAKHCNNYAPKM